MSLVRITKDLSLEEVHRGTVDPINVYTRLVDAWIFEPAKQMTKNYPNETDHGMALLALLLLYFEPHGQFLTGKSSKGQSKHTFCTAFNAFRTYLSEHAKIPPETNELSSESFYKWARCGLFHSGRMSSELLVDALGISASCLAKNPILGGWLVNPWQLLVHLRNYNEAYGLKLIKADINDRLRTNFLQTYQALVKEPADHFNTLQSKWLEA